MAGKRQTETTPRDVLRVLFRHKRKATIFFIVVMLVTVGVTLLSSPVYYSEGKFFVRLGRENATLDPTAGLGQDPIVAIPTSRENEINSVVEILKSRVVAEKVVDTIGPEAILGEGSPDDLSQQNGVVAAIGRVTVEVKSAMGIVSGWLRQLSPGEEPSDRDLAITEFSRQLGVEPAKKSNVIRVSYQGSSPELSQDVVARLTDFYLEEHIRLNRTSGAQEFFNEQTSRLKLDLTEAEKELCTLKDETGVSSPEEQRLVIVTRIGRLEDDLLKTTSSIAASETRVKLLGDKLATLPQTRVSSETTGVTSEGTSRMRDRLYALQMEAEEAVATYQPDHPKLDVIRDQMAASQKVLDLEEESHSEVTVGPDLIHEEARAALLVEEPLLSSLRVEAEYLSRQLADVREELVELNESALQIGRIEREVELKDANYRKYSANLEQTLIDHALETERMSNISVVQPATYNVEPIHPRKLLNLALGILVGVIGGLGLALLAEYLDHSLKTPEDIEEKLDMPVLVSVPSLRRKQLVVNGRG